MENKKNLLISVQLTRLNRVGRITLNDRNGNKVDCLAIPIELNNLSVSNSNEIYLNLVGWESDKLKDGQTHLLKQSLSKEIVERMSEDDKKNMPIMGNVAPMKKKETPMEVYSYGAAPVPAPTPDPNNYPIF